MTNARQSDAAAHPLAAALAAQARRWPRPETGIGPAEPGWPTLGEVYADPDLVERMLMAQARFTPGLDRKGQAAYLMTSHALAIGTVAAACFVGAGLAPRLGPEALALSVHVPGPEDREDDTAIRLLSAGFATDDAGLSDHPDAESLPGREALCARMRIELEAHFAPVVARLHAAAGLAKGALWRLAGDSVAGQFLDAGQRFRREPEARADALRILKHPGSPLANKEMHFFDIAFADPKRPEKTLFTRGYRARGGCCRWYTAAPGHLCTTCVLRSEADRRAAIEDGLRRRLGLPPLAEPASP
ncbi:MAG: (2Fe-2S)-binding protein [Pikeienuella sp.]